MTDKLPPPLLALFQPRPPVKYIPPQDSGPDTKASKQSQLGGLAAFLPQLEVYKEEDEYEPTESWLQRRDRLAWEKRTREAEISGDAYIKKVYHPDQDPKVKGDPIRTLFVGRLAYDVKEKDLQNEFGRFGPIERIRIVRDERSQSNDTKDKKRRKEASRGYAFIVFDKEKDCKAAYKENESPRIRDRRAIVDIERGRTVAGWKPRRLGGGLGGRGYSRVQQRPVYNGAQFATGANGFRPGGLGDRGGRGGRDFGGRAGGFRDQRGGGFGGRGGIGYQGEGRGGFGGRPPAGAPSGPGGRLDDRRNGGGYGGGGYGGRDSDRGRDGGRDGGRPRYDDRGPRRDDDYGSRKRYNDDRGNGYDDRETKRRY